MKLSSATIRPGKVLEVLDNKGTIKASAPGLFTSQDKDKLPPIMHAPWGAHPNSFTTPDEGKEVWIINFTDNKRQLYWFRKDPFDKNNSDNNNVQDEQNVEILWSRKSGMGWATIYFSDDSGWIIRNDDSKIQINPDGEICLSLPEAHRTIDINSDGISIGSKGSSAHPATYADKLEDILSTINQQFALIKQAATTNPYTAAIGSVIDTSWSNKIPDIESIHVTID